MSVPITAVAVEAAVPTVALPSCSRMRGRLGGVARLVASEVEEHRRPGRHRVREVGCLMRGMRLIRPPGGRLNDPGMVTCEALQQTPPRDRFLGHQALRRGGAELSRSAAEGLVVGDNYNREAFAAAQRATVAPNFHEARAILSGIADERISDPDGAKYVEFCNDLAGYASSMASSGRPTSTRGRCWSPPTRSRRCPPSPSGGGSGIGSARSHRWSAAGGWRSGSAGGAGFKRNWSAGTDCQPASERPDAERGAAADGGA